jgi:hypothetical protein
MPMENATRIATVKYIACCGLGHCLARMSAAALVAKSMPLSVVSGRKQRNMNPNDSNDNKAQHPIFSEATQFNATMLSIVTRLVPQDTSLQNVIL